MRMTVELEGNLGATFDRIVKDFPEIADTVTEAYALEFKHFLRDRFLSGQVLDSVTGELKKEYKYKRLRGGVYWVYPGRLGYVNIFETGGEIVASKKKALKFVIDGKEIFVKKVRIPKKPFMSQAKNQFQSGTRGSRHAERILMAMIEDRGLDADG